MYLINVFGSHYKKSLVLLINYELFESATNSVAFVSCQPPLKILVEAGRWLSGEEYILLLQRIHFLALRLCGSKPPITPALGNPTTSPTL